MAQGDQSPSAPVEASTDQIRATAKWFIGAYGAIGAVALAELNLTDAGELAGWSRVWATVSYLLVFVGISLSISGIAALLVPRGRTLPDLLDAPARDPAVAFINSNPQVMGPFTSLRALQRALNSDLAAYRVAFAAWRASPTAHHAKRLNNVQTRLRPTVNATETVSALASYRSLQADYGRMIRLRVFPGLTLVAIGALWFSFLVGEPTPSKAPQMVNAGLEGADLSDAAFASADLSGANLRSAILVNADLSDANLSNSVLSYADMTGANLRNANLTGADLSNVTWAGTTCPDGFISDEVGGSCLSHVSLEEG